MCGFCILLRLNINMQTEAAAEPDGSEALFSGPNPQSAGANVLLSVTKARYVGSPPQSQGALVHVAL